MQGIEGNLSFNLALVIPSHWKRHASSIFNVFFLRNIINPLRRHHFPGQFRRDYLLSMGSTRYLLTQLWLATCSRIQQLTQQFSSRPSEGGSHPPLFIKGLQSFDWGHTFSRLIQQPYMIPQTLATPQDWLVSIQNHRLQWSLSAPPQHHRDYWAPSVSHTPSLSTPSPTLLPTKN